MLSSNTKPRRIGLPCWAYLLAASGAVIAFFWSQGDHVAATVIASITFVASTGYRMGAIKAIGMYGSLVIAGLSARPMGRLCEPICHDLMGASGVYNRFLSMGVAATVTMITFVVLSFIIAASLTKDRPKIKGIDRWLGLGLGGVQGCLLALLVLGGVLVVEPFAKNRLYSDVTGGQAVMGRAVSKRVIDTARQIRVSSMGRCVARWNPFERVPQLRQIQETVATFHDSRAMQDLAMESDRSGSSLTSTLQDVARDPEMRAILHSSRHQRRAVQNVMRNPTIADLLRTD